ncbi:MAG: hypothetical protein EOO75_15755, partial [Myxococcales bacterium]
HGQLGLGDTAHRGDGPGAMGTSLPAIGLGRASAVAQLAPLASSTCVRFADRKVKCWGKNDKGQLGLGDIGDRGDGPGEMGASLPALDLGSVLVDTLVAGGEQACVQTLAEANAARCWGLLPSGEGTGDGANEMGGNLPVLTLTSASIVQLRAGRDLLALDENALVTHHVATASGYQPYPLDLGSDSAVIGLAGRGELSCAWRQNGSVKCWGNNDLGQLGLGDTTDRLPEANQVNPSLAPVDLGTGGAVVQVVVGAAHVCALRQAGSVKCWGDNSFGQLGQGDTAARGDGPGEMGTDLLTVKLGSTSPVVQLAAGAHHTCARRQDGRVKCWGRNDRGQLGLGDTGHRGDGPDEMGTDLPTVDLTP